MAWLPFGIGKSSKQEQQPQPQPQPVSEDVYLDDLPPKFSTGESHDPLNRHQQQMQQRTMFKSAFDSISWSDFSLGNLVKIPCFRDAGLIGLSSMGVLGTTIFLIHKNPAKASNWAVGAGLLGSLVGWEQCRTQRKRSFENVEKAKATIRAKPRPMVHKKQDDENGK